MHASPCPDEFLWVGMLECKDVLLRKDLDHVHARLIACVCKLSEREMKLPTGAEPRGILTNYATDLSNRKQGHFGAEPRGIYPCRNQLFQKIIWVKIAAIR